MRSDASSGRREEHVPPTEQENKDAEIEELHKRIAQLEAQRVTTSDVDRSARSTSTAATTFMTARECYVDLCNANEDPSGRVSAKTFKQHLGARIKAQRDEEDQLEAPEEEFVDAKGTSARIRQAEGPPSIMSGMRLKGGRGWMCGST